MEVTILTPTLNAERYFPECLASLRAQTHPRGRIQHLVLDGGSNDRTVQLAHDAGAEVHVRPDGSLYEALNRGVQLASGEIVGWLNADDAYEPGAIARVVEVFRETPGAEIVVGDYEMASPASARVVRTNADALRRIRSGTRHGSWVTPFAVFYRTETLRTLGPYAAGYRVAADLDMWLRAAAREPPLRVAHAGIVLGTFRVHADSLSSGANPEKSLRETIDVARRWYLDTSCPEGVRRFSLFLLRRHTYLLTIWELRSTSRARKALAALACYRELRRMRPGALGDMMTSLTG